MRKIIIIVAQFFSVPRWNDIKIEKKKYNEG